MKSTKPLKELLDSVRNIEGFPIGKDEDILALSDPPYYTACPNPYINEFIEEHGTLRQPFDTLRTMAQGAAYDEAMDDYHREPFVGDVSEGKNDPIYNAHSYHTKVPHKAIMKYIEHYTDEGDIVFDGFCGTGMTGVAAQLLNRKAILSDLSPIATFIAYNYNKKVDVAEFEREAHRILREVEEECGWMYETNPTPDVIARSAAPALSEAEGKQSHDGIATSRQGGTRDDSTTVTTGEGKQSHDSELSLRGAQRRSNPALTSKGSPRPSAQAEELAMTNPLSLRASVKQSPAMTVGVQSEMFEKKKKNGKGAALSHSPERAEGLSKGKINYTVWSDVFLCPYCGEEIVFWEAAVDKEAGSVKKEFPCPHCNAAMKKTDCKRATVTFFDAAIGREVTQAKQVPVLINFTYNSKRYEKTPDAEDLALIKKIEESEIPYWFPTDRMPEGDEARRNDRMGITHVHHFYTKRNLWVLASFYDKILNIEKRLLIVFESIAGQLSNKLSRYNMGNRGNGPVSGTLYVASMTAETNIIKVAKTKLKNIVSALEIIEGENYINTSSLENVPIYSDSIDYIFTDPPFGDNLMYSELNFLWESWLKVKTNNASEAIINKSQNKALPEYYDLMLKSFKEYYRVLKPNRWITVEFHNSKSSVWNAIQEAMSKAGFIIANVTILDKKQGSFKQVTSDGAVKNDLVISAYKPKQSFERRFLEQTGQGLEEDFIRMHLSHLPAEPSVERTEQMLYSKLLAYYVQRGYAVKYDAKTFYKMLHNYFEEEDGYWFNADQLPAYREYKKKLKLEGLADVKKGQLNMFVLDEKSALQWLHAFLAEPKDFKTIHPAFTKVANISGDRTPDLRELLEDNFIREGDKYRRPQSEEEKTTLIQKREKELLREFESLLLQAKASQKKIKECRKQAVLFGFEHCYKAGRFQDILTLARRLDKRIIENDAEINDFIEVAELKVEGF